MLTPTAVVMAHIHPMFRTETRLQTLFYTRAFAGHRKQPVHPHWDSLKWGPLLIRIATISNQYPPKSTGLSRRLNGVLFLTLACHYVPCQSNKRHSRDFFILRTKFQIRSSHATTSEVELNKAIAFSRHVIQKRLS
jgi:hypothetical protein